VMMPRAEIFIALMPPLWVGAGMLMIMDASFNVAMEPFRALVADKLDSRQRTMGFSIQTVLIGLGAVVGSWLPYVLTNWLGVSNENETGGVPPHLVLSFVVGALFLTGAILITVLTTREYSPEEMKDFNGEEEERQEKSKGLLDIITDFKNMPTTMQQLSYVQFFSWFGLFGMWVYTTPAVAHHIYDLAMDDTHSALYQEAGDWVGVMFGVYNAVSAVFAFFLPTIASKIGRKRTHSLSLIAGGLGLLSIYVINDPAWLVLPMVAIGISWASILAMPYAILAGSIPPARMGVYMGIFNFFIVLPQIVNALFGGPLVKYLYGGNPVYALVMSGVSFLIAALLVGKVNDLDDGVN